MNNKFPNDDFLARWLSGELSKGDLSPEDQVTIDELEKITTFSSKLEVPTTQTKEEAWEKFSKLIEPEEKPKVRSMVPAPWMKIASGIAAGLAILISVFYFTKDSNTTYKTPIAEQKTVYLPDSSYVILNSASSLAFNENTWAESREITLQGEGFVQVKKGSSFVVNTSKGTVSVLGTSFNVLDRKDVYSVACYTGKVKVEGNNFSEVLTPGKKVSLISEGTWESQSFEADDTQPQWAVGKFEFKQASFSQVINELERQFDIQVEYPEMAGRTYSGAFFNSDVNVALQMICDPMDLSFTFVDKSHVKLMPLSR